MGFTLVAGRRRPPRARDVRQGRHRPSAETDDEEIGPRRGRPRRVRLPLRRGGRLTRTRRTEPRRHFMKLIMAIIRPHKLEEVKKALNRSRRAGMSVYRDARIRTHGRQDRGLPGSAYSGRLRPQDSLDLRGRRRLRCNRFSMRSSGAPRPARSATARCSCSMWRRPCAFEPVSAARSPFSFIRRIPAPRLTVEAAPGRPQGQSSPFVVSVAPL